MSFRRALIWSSFWVGLSLLTGLLIAIRDPAIGFQFLAGWMIEKALSVDNLFVFLMLFTYFKVTPDSQRRVLNYGVAGVLLTRGLLIFAGIALIQQFQWLMYVLGAVVIYTGVLMAFRKEEEEFDGEKNWIVRLARKFIPVSSGYHGSKFFTRENGKLLATPLVIVVVVIELSDIMFSLDSLPAIFSVSRNPFVIYSSNILAVLGLRSLYFMLERMQAFFVHMKKAVGVILWFVGLKMILPLFWPKFEIDTPISLIVIVLLLIIGVLASLVFPVQKSTEPKPKT
jgi:tellurite resistance protein TerC